MKCSQIKANGIRCGANATKGSSFCFTHNPAYTEKRREAVSKGGQNRKLYGVYGEAVDIQKAKDIKKLLVETINGIRTGKIPSNQPAATIGFLSRCWLEANKEAQYDNMGFNFGEE